MFFDQMDIDRVRDQTDLAALIGEHVVLKTKGREHVGLCPFHDDKNPSFAVVTHKGNHFYKCHSCGASGDCFTFLQEYLQQSFSEAVEYLADRSGIQLERKADGNDHSGKQRSDRKAWLRKAALCANEFFRANLKQDSGRRAMEAITRRGIQQEMVERFELGAAPASWDALRTAIVSEEMPEKVLVAAGLLKKRQESEGTYDAFRDRLIFPIHDESGHPIAFGARSLSPEDQPKYLNSAEHDLFYKGKTLYGMHLARPAIVKKKQAIVTEGYTDVIACHAAGFNNVVGTLGTALTDDHARKLARLGDRIVLIFDGDEAGQNAAERAVRNVFRHPVDVAICVLPEGLDPDDLLSRPDGHQQFSDAVDTAVDAIEFLLSRFSDRLDSSDGLSARQRVLEQFIESLRGLGLNEADGLRRSMLVNQIADLMGVPARDIEGLLQRSRPTRSRGPEQADTTPPSLQPTGARHVAERDLIAIVLYQSELFVEIDRSPEAVLSGDRFQDPSHMALAETMRELLKENPPTMQAILGNLDEEPLRELASRLYFVGERLVKDALIHEQTNPLERANESLEQQIQEEDLRQDVADWRNRDHTDERTPADVIRTFGSRKRRPSAILRTGRDE
ncbi:MAG: DNA primase [Phycisphaerae bacterium]|nr:DNA primase [Phycisphaerae bacterium]